MIRGIITDRDKDTVQVRVKFPETGLTSNWLKVLVPLAKESQCFYLPRINEQVICLMDENMEDGVVIGAVYTKTQVSPTVPDTDSVGWLFEPNTYAYYYAADNKLGATVGNASVEVENNTATMDAAGCIIEAKNTGVKISTPAENLKAILTDILTQLEVLTVTCTAPTTPSSPPINLAAFTAIKLRLSNLFQ